MSWFAAPVLYLTKQAKKKYSAAMYILRAGWVGYTSVSTWACTVLINTNKKLGLTFRMARSTPLGSSSQAITCETSLTLSNFSWKMADSEERSSLLFNPTYLHQSNSPTTTFILAVFGLKMAGTQCLAVRMCRFVRMVPPHLPVIQFSVLIVELSFSTLQSEYTKRTWYGAKTEKLPPIILFSLASLLSSFFATQLRVSGPGPNKRISLSFFSDL